MHRWDPPRYYRHLAGRFISHVYGPLASVPPKAQATSSTSSVALLYLITAKQVDPYQVA